MSKEVKAEISHDSWLEKGRNLFGDDYMKWRFICPVCKNIATPGDFKSHKDKGATPSSAAQECIGRYLPKESRGGFSSKYANQSVKQPCDYAAYGFFQLAPYNVRHKDGDLMPSFAFAEEASGDV